MENEEQNFTDFLNVTVADNETLLKIPLGQTPTSNEVGEIF